MCAKFRGGLIFSLLLSAGLALSGCSDDAVSGETNQRDVSDPGQDVADTEDAGKSDGDTSDIDASDSDVADSVTADSAELDVDESDADTPDGVTPDTDAPDGATPDADVSESDTSDSDTNDTCEVSRFEVTCEPDEFEPNEEWLTLTPLDEADGWCSDEQTSAIKSYSARLCGGDTDLHQIRVLRASSNQCISGRTRITVTIDLEDVECDPELFAIYPFSSTGQDICDSDERVRCTSSNDGRRFEIIWAMEDESYADVYFAVETDELDFMLDYDFSVKVDGW